MPVLSPADARVHEHGGFTFTSLAVPSRGTAELALWTVEVPAGATSEPHSMDREEVFWVAAGAVTAEGVGTAAASRSCTSSLTARAASSSRAGSSSPSLTAPCSPTGALPAGVRATRAG